jgi:hypothetical protein
MTTFADCSINVGKESTYGTAVAGTTAYEFNSEGFNWLPNRVQGTGLRVSGRIPRSGRRVTTTSQAEGSLEIDAQTKGMARLLEAALGTGTSTLVSGTTYQHNYTLGDTPPALTIQKSVPRVDGTIDPYTFAGCMVSGWELNVANDDIAKFNFDFDIRSMDTARAFDALTYPTTPSLYHFGQAAITIGGAVTVPTSTALGTGGTAATDVRDFSLSVNNNLTTDRFNYGASGLKAKPSVGMREITGSFTAEYAATTYRAAYVADTDLAITVTLTSAEALSSGFATLQVVLPICRLESAVPVANNGDLVTVEHSFTVLDGLVAAQPLYLVTRTSDSSI